jgi:putative CocE/NonD family hydrolase
MEGSMTDSIRVDTNIPMKMRDGIVLMSDVYRPDDSERHPAIVVRTPYSKGLGGNSDFLSAQHAAFAGYAFVIQDTRGRFASGGEFMPGAQEGKDGYDTIETVAAEPWCDGNVGTVGSSYLGRNQWQAALEQPPHLKAIAPSIATAGPLSDFRLGGPIDLEQSISWFTAMAIDMLERQRQQGKDVSEAREMLDQARLNPGEVYSHLPLKDVPHFQFEGLKEASVARMTDALPDSIKTEDDLHWAYEKITVPCFHAGGWYDIFSGSLFAGFRGMKEHGGSEVAREGQHVLCGPWGHGGSLLAYVGGLHFGPAGSAIATFTMQRHITFFDRYLKGIEGRHMAPVRYFVMGANRWRNADAWPLPNTDWQRFYLHSKGRANTAAGDGVLSRDDPAAEPPDVYVYDPRFPVPTVGGRVLPTGTLIPGPFDQTSIEGRGDVLCYTTPELSEALEVTGPLKLHLFAATSTRDTDFTAKLIDVRPNGAAYNVAEGVIRARYRKSVLKAEFVTPGETNEYVIDLAVTSIVFGPGHRIRLDVTSSNFPRIDRNMNTGNAFGEDTEGVPAVQTVYHQPDRASYIDLPVIPAGP